MQKRAEGVSVCDLVPGMPAWTDNASVHGDLERAEPLDGRHVRRSECPLHIGECDAEVRVTDKMEAVM